MGKRKDISLATDEFDNLRVRDMAPPAVVLTLARPPAPGGSLSGLYGEFCGVSKI